jgi:hypothetical protein
MRARRVQRGVGVLRGEKLSLSFTALSVNSLSQYSETQVPAAVLAALVTLELFAVRLLT